MTDFPSVIEWRKRWREKMAAWSRTAEGRLRRSVWAFQDLHDAHTRDVCEVLDELAELRAENAALRARLEEGGELVELPAAPEAPCTTAQQLSMMLPFRGTG